MSGQGHSNLLGSDLIYQVLYEIRKLVERISCTFIKFISIRRTMKKIATYILSLLAGIQLSCQDTEEFKIPSDIGFRMDVNREGDAGSQLSFTSGYITLASFSFDGEREQGGDVFFEKEYEQGLQIPFDATKPVDALAFQVPQGNYVRIEVEMETYDDAAVAGLVVYGAYLHSNGIRYPIQFELSSSINMEIKARDKSGSSHIVLKQSSPATGKIRLDPVKWFEAVPLSLLDNAVLTAEENHGENEEEIEFGSSYILINEEINEGIYEIIITRIEQSAEMIFE